MIKKVKNGQGYKPRFSFVRKKDDTLKDVGLRAGVWGGAAAASLISQTSSSEALRNVIPEPLDLIDHAGNLAPSMMVGAGVTYLSALIGSRFSNAPRSVRRVATVLGGTAVVVANLLVETKYGLNLYSTVNNHTTPDVLDIAYGVGAGVLASSLVDVVPVGGAKVVDTKSNDTARTDSTPVWYS